MVETAATARVGFDRNKTSGSPYPLILSPVHCGVYTATLRLMAFSDLWTSDYGRTLFAKLVLFGVMIAFGAYHLLIVRPQTLTQIVHATVLITDWQQRRDAALVGSSSLSNFKHKSHYVGRVVALPALRAIRPAVFTGMVLE